MTTSVKEVGEAEILPEARVFSNSSLVHVILDKLSIPDLKSCAPTNSLFRSEAAKLFAKKSKICLDSSSRLASYLEYLKNGGTIPTTPIVHVTVSTRREFDCPHWPKRFPYQVLEIVPKIGGDKIRCLTINVDVFNNFLAKSRNLISLAVNLAELELDFKHPNTNFVAVLPLGETFELPNLKKLCLSVFEVKDDAGKTRIREFLQRFFAISPNLETFHGTEFNNKCRHDIVQLFLEEVAKIPDRMEKIKELFLPNYEAPVVSIFRRGNFAGLRVLKLNVDEWNAFAAEGILHHFKSALTKLVIILERVFDKDPEEENILKMPVMENLKELELSQNARIGEDAVGLVIDASSSSTTGKGFEKLQRLKISVALMRTTFLDDPNTTPARFPALTRIDFGENREDPGDEMLQKIWDIFSSAEISMSIAKCAKLCTNYQM